MQKDFDGWNNRAIIETNRWGCSFYAGVCTSSQQRESWEVLSLTPIERPLEYSMTESSSKTKLESVENGAAALACPPKLQRRQAGGGSTVVSRRVLRTNLVSHSIDAGKLMSSGEEIGVVENSSLKPDRGEDANTWSICKTFGDIFEPARKISQRCTDPVRIRPLGHKLTRLVPHHASGYGGFYHTLLITFLFPLILSTFYFIPTQTSAAARLQMPPNYLSIGTGLVGYWTFDGATTTWSSATAGITGDLSGNFNTGTLTNMNRATSPAIGKIGQALKFNGTNSYVSIGDNSSLNLSTSFTVSAWTKRNNGAVADDQIYVSGTQSGYWGIYRDATKLAFYERGIAGYTANTTLKDDVWYHVVVVKNGDGANNLTFYINGVTDGSASVGSVSLPSGEKRIGCWTEGTGSNVDFDGLIDDVRIYNRALSAGEVTQLYNIGKAKANVSNAVISNGLVGYWTFDGATTTWSSATAGITGDLSGNFNTGTLTNMNRATSPAIGKIGQGLKFDGVDDYVGTADSSSLDITDKITISAWVNSFSAANRTNYGRVLEKSKDTTECIEPYTIYDLIFLPTGEAKFDIAIGGLAKGMASITVPSLNTWYHLVGTYDGSNMRIYVNGALDNTLAQSGTLNTSNNGLRFADSSLAGPCGSGLFNGLVDDVRIYNRALSAGEVGQLYQQGAAKVNKSPTSLLTNGLVGYWTFDGATTTWSSATAGITGDLSGNFNTGTLTNMSQSTNPAIGKIGQGLKFDGSNDYVNAGSGSSVNVTGAITACFWVKTSSSGMSGVMGNRGGSGNGGYVIMLRGEEGGGVNYRIGFTYFGVLDWYSSNNAYIANNQWQHLCVVNPATGNIRFYANGAQHSTAASANSGTSSDQPLYVGAWNNSGTPANYFNGLIDDVRIYNRALSANEVKQLYNIGR